MSKDHIYKIIIIREKTGASYQDIIKALKASEWNINKAREWILYNIPHTIGSIRKCCDDE